MNLSQKNRDDQQLLSELESKIASLKKQMQKLEEEKMQSEDKRDFFNKIADFSNDWELWFSPEKKIRYCSPSCMDITGYSPKQIVDSLSISDLLILEDDHLSFNNYLKDVLSLTIIRQSHEFRLVTRSRQVRWCEMSCRAVHDKFGKYLGIRASVRDVTKLKNALSHIKQLSEKRRLDTELKHQLSDELDAQEREMSSYLLILSQKNELISYLEKNIIKLDSLNTQHRKKKIDEILQKISQNNTVDMDWELFKDQFEKLYPGFFENIIEVHPNLTQNDLRLCTFLKLNMSTKEIAGLLNISPKSIEVARVRLRKKLKLKREQQLKLYFSSF